MQAPVSVPRPDGAPQNTFAMKIAILDDYQDAVRKLDCFQLLADHDVKVFNNTVRGLGQLASRLGEVEALVLIRERTRINSQLLDKLPHLRMIGKLPFSLNLSQVRAPPIPT